MESKRETPVDLDAIIQHLTSLGKQKEKEINKRKKEASLYIEELCLTLTSKDAWELKKKIAEAASDKGPLSYLRIKTGTTLVFKVSYSDKTGTYGGINNALDAVIGEYALFIPKENLEKDKGKGKDKQNKDNEFYLAQFESLFVDKKIAIDSFCEKFLVMEFTEFTEFKELSQMSAAPILALHCENGEVLGIPIALNSPCKKLMSAIATTYNIHFKKDPCAITHLVITEPANCTNKILLENNEIELLLLALDAFGQRKTPDEAKKLAKLCIQESLQTEWTKEDCSSLKDEIVKLALDEGALSYLRLKTKQVMSRTKQYSDDNTTYQFILKEIDQKISNTAKDEKRLNNSPLVQWLKKSITKIYAAEADLKTERTALATKDDEALFLKQVKFLRKIEKDIFTLLSYFDNYAIPSALNKARMLTLVMGYMDYEKHISYILSPEIQLSIQFMQDINNKILAYGLIQIPSEDQETPITTFQEVFSSKPSEENIKRFWKVLEVDIIKAQKALKISPSLIMPDNIIEILSESFFESPRWKTLNWNEDNYQENIKSVLYDSFVPILLRQTRYGSIVHPITYEIVVDLIEVIEKTPSLTELLPFLNPKAISSLFAQTPIYFKHYYEWEYIYESSNNNIFYQKEVPPQTPKVEKMLYAYITPTGLYQFSRKQNAYINYISPELLAEYNLSYEECEQNRSSGNNTKLLNQKLIENGGISFLDKSITNINEPWYFNVTTLALRSYLLVPLARRLSTFSQKDNLSKKLDFSQLAYLAYLDHDANEPVEKLIKSTIKYLNGRLRSLERFCYENIKTIWDQESQGKIIRFNNTLQEAVNNEEEYYKLILLLLMKDYNLDLSEFEELDYLSQYVPLLIPELKATFDFEAYGLRKAVEASIKHFDGLQGEATSNPNSFFGLPQGDTTTTTTTTTFEM